MGIPAKAGIHANMSVLCTDSRFRGNAKWGMKWNLILRVLIDYAGSLLLIQRTASSNSPAA